MQLLQLKIPIMYLFISYGSRLRSYLFDWKLFLEHWKKYIDDGAQTVYWTNKAGSDKYVKAYQKYYTDVTRNAYDSCPEYVLATAIRNHVAHDQKAISSYDICPTGTSQGMLF